MKNREVSLSASEWIDKERMCVKVTYKLRVRSTTATVEILEETQRFETFMRSVFFYVYVAKLFLRTIFWFCNSLPRSLSYKISLYLYLGRYVTRSSHLVRFWFKIDPVSPLSFVPRFLREIQGNSRFNKNALGFEFKLSQQFSKNNRIIFTEYIFESAL